MTEFKPGDIVRLKSGGPIMTVEEEVAEASGKFYCSWFVEGIRKREIFLGVTLETVEWSGFGIK